MTKKTIEFEYKVPDDYAPVHANGCFGGRIPSGEIVINFFSERTPIPNSETFEVSDDGNLGVRVRTEPETIPLIRTVSCGIILTEENAKSIHAWLGRVLGVQK